MVFLTILAVFISDLLGRLKRWLTFRRVLGLVALLILLLMVKGLVFDMGMGADLSILFGLDWGMAIEVSALLIALSVRDHLVAFAYAVKSWVSQRKPVTRVLRRFARRATRSRLASSLLRPPPEDDPAAWILSAA